MTRVLEAEPGGTVHASAVALGGRGLLILGPSGSGKSALALALMALGATLVSDDRVRLDRDGERVLASAPPTLAGRIEARGVGILTADAAGPSALALAADLGASEADRLPPARLIDILGVKLRLLQDPGGPHFAAALLACLRGGLAG